jgi:hypothetical protein
MKKSIPVVVVIMIAALVLSACGAGPAPSGGAQAAPTEAGQKSANQPAAQPTQPPAEKPVAVDNPTATPESIELANVTAGLGELDSYKASFTMTFEGEENGQPRTGTMSFTEEFVKEPPAKRTVITGFGALFGGGTGTPTPDQSSGAIESIEVGGKQYSRLGEICTQVTAESGPQANTMLDPNSIIGGVRGAQRVGNETINGVPTVHYKIDVTGLETMGYLNGDGDVWVAEPGNFVVKYVFQATGKDTFFGSTSGEGTIKWDYEVTDVNQPINIQPPADCSGASEDIPMMADAQDQAAFGGTSTYSTPSQFEDVVAFYEEEMKANGWTEAEGGMSAEGVSMKSYTKDGRTVQIMITSDSGGKTSVMITEEKK